jgi:glycosyltransferase involved in cell wall biosynthesis
MRYFLAPVHVSVAAARNDAIRHATGPWLAFLDQDDIWLPLKLEQQSALIDRDQTGELTLVYGRATRFDQRGRTSAFDPWHGAAALPEGDIFSELLSKPSFVALSSAVIPRQAVLDLGGIPPDIVYCPDYYLFVHMTRRGRAACVQELCCLYRVHTTNMSRVFRKQIHEEALHIIGAAANSSQGTILRRRRLVHQTWIGVEEMRGWQHPWAGLTRILLRGSFLYLALRPFVLISRRVRDWKLGHS